MALREQSTMLKRELNTENVRQPLEAEMPAPLLLPPTYNQQEISNLSSTAKMN